MSAPTTTHGGAHRVAALLLSLDQDAAAALLKTIHPDVLPRVAAAMARIEAEGQEGADATAVWRELVRELEGQAAPAPRARDEKELRRFLELGLGPERASAVLDEMRERRRLERPFANVEEAPPARIAKALAAESVAVRALVLGHLPPRAAASVLAAFEPADALRVIDCMSKAGAPRRETVDLVARSLQAEVERLNAEPEPPPPAERMRSIAQILTSADKALGQNVLSGLNEANRGVAEQIREMMFTWEDLAKLERRAMQKVLSTIETGQLALALKGGPVEVEQNILSNLSQRVRDMVAEERELLGARPKSEVDAARAELMKSVRALIESGELATNSGDETLVT